MDLCLLAVAGALAIGICLGSLWVMWYMSEEEEDVSPRQCWCGDARHPCDCGYGRARQDKD